MSEELRTIYAEKDGEMPDLTKLDRRQTSRLTRFLAASVIVLAVIAGAAWGGFFLWTRGVFQNEAPLEVSFEGPDHVSAGQLAYFTIHYRNREALPISGLEMKLNLPLGFTILSASPEAIDGTNWKFDTLSGDSDGSIVLSGIFRSEVPSTQTMQAFFTYAPSNTSSTFQEIAVWRATIDQSVLKVAVTGPEKALPGDEATYVVNIQNASSERVERVRVAAVLPTGFTVTGAEPAANAPDIAPQWDVEGIDPGALMAFTLHGRFTTTASGDQMLGARVHLLTEDGTELAQASADTHTDVLGGNLAFHLVANGSSETTSVDLADTVRVSIDYANSGNERIEGVEFSLNVDGGGKTLPIDWEKADLGGGTRSGSTITWTDGLQSLDPNASGIIDVSLPIVSDLKTATTADRVSLTLSASLTKVGSVESPRTIEAPAVVVAINSDLNGSAEARYYTDEGEPIGTGPLPPKAGETTTYRIFWDLSNTIHGLSNVVLTTNLPPDVTWIDKKQSDIGAITFDGTTRLVRWTIPALPTSIPVASGFFDVAITPDENDAGAFFKLTNATSIDAHDDTTGDTISHALDILTTELPTDESAAGKGIVTE